MFVTTHTFVMVKTPVLPPEVNVKVSYGVELPNSRGLKPIVTGDPFAMAVRLLVSSCAPKGLVRLVKYTPVEFQKSLEVLMSIVPLIWVIGSAIAAGATARAVAKAK